MRLSSPRGAAQDNNAKTITISSLPDLQDKGLWALDLTYDSSYIIYLGDGTNSLNLIGYGTIISSGARVVINSNAFQNCSKLVRIWIEGNNVAQIGSRAFLNCTSLNSITLPSTITTVGSYAFRLCTNLEEITINGDIETIGAGASSDCKNVKKLTLGADVTSIPSNLFSTGLLTNLTEIVVLGDLNSTTFPSGTWTKGGTTVTQFSGAGTYLKSEE